MAVPYKNCEPPSAICASTRTTHELSARQRGKPVRGGSLLMFRHLQLIAGGVPFASAAEARGWAHQGCALGVQTTMLEASFMLH